MGPLYSHWQQCPLKNFLIKEPFHRKCFRNTSFDYSHHFFVPHWSFITNFSKVFFKEKCLLWKENSAKKKFSFLSSELCTPTHNIVKIFFYKKTTKQKQFFPNYVFLSLFVWIPVDDPYKTNLIFLAKATSSEKNVFSKL